MKIIENFQKLTFKEKSDFVASWLQVCAVIIGIIFGLQQLKSATEANRLNYVKNSFEVIDQYDGVAGPIFDELDTVDFEAFRGLPRGEKKEALLEEKFSGPNAIDVKLEVMLQAANELRYKAANGLCDKNLMIAELTQQNRRLIANVRNLRKEYPDNSDLFFLEDRLQSHYESYTTWWQRFSYNYL